MIEALSKIKILNMMNQANAKKYKKKPENEEDYKAFANFRVSQKEGEITELLKKEYQASEYDAKRIGKKIGSLL
jgi:hypothetical protein